MVTVVIGAHDSEQNITGVPELKKVSGYNPLESSLTYEVYITVLSASTSVSIVTINQNFTKETKVRYLATGTGEAGHVSMRLKVDGTTIDSKTISGTTGRLNTDTLEGETTVSEGSHTFVFEYYTSASSGGSVCGGSLQLTWLEA